MNGIRVQRVTTLFMVAEVDFWMKYFECFGGSSGLMGTPPTADLHFFHAKFCREHYFLYGTSFGFLTVGNWCLSISSTKATVVQALHLHIVTKDL